MRKQLTEDADFNVLVDIGVQGGTESAQFLEAWKKTADKRIAYCRTATFEEYSDLCYYSFLPVVGHKLVKKTDFLKLFADMNDETNITITLFHPP